MSEHLCSLHLADLAASGLLPKTIEVAGLRCVSQDEISEVLGFNPGCGGLLFPYPNQNGGGLFFRVKPDVPFIGKDGKPSKYLSAKGSRNRLYIPKIVPWEKLSSKRETLIVTEGEKKALKAAQQDIACVALAGVWAWRDKSGPIKDLNVPYWKGRRVYIAFDSDAAINPKVKTAEFELAKELRRRGAVVEAIRIPPGPDGSKVGLDDFLLTHSIETFWELLADPLIEEPKRILAIEEFMATPSWEVPSLIADLDEQIVAELLGQKRGSDSFLHRIEKELGEETNSLWGPRSLAELYAQAEEKIVWVLDKIIPMGSLFLIIAFMKLGKSELAYRLTVAVSKGDSFLGMRTQKTAVLILAVEEHQRDIKLRLKRLGAGPEDTIFIQSGRLLNSPETITKIREFIQQKSIGLVFIDTLTRFWNVDDENNNQGIIREVSPLLDLARETGAAIGLMHHDRKSGGEDGRSIRGGGALFGLVDQAILLERRHGGADTQRVLKTLGRYSESPKELVIDLVDGEYQVVGTPEQAGKKAVKEKLYSALLPEPLTIAQLVKETGLHSKRTYDLMSELFSEGRVIREGEGSRGNPYTYRRPKE